MTQPKGEQLRFTCDAADLAATIGVAAKASGRPNSIQALRYLTVRARKTEKRLEFFSTDLDIAIDAALPCKTIAKSGVVVVADGPKFAQALKLIAGEVTVSANDAVLLVEAGTASMSFELGIKENAPSFKATEPEAKNTSIVDGPAFVDLFKAVGSAISTDYTRPVLTGLLVQTVKGSQTLRMVGTDSYRLAIGEATQSIGLYDYTTLLPNKAAAIAAKLAPAVVRIADGGSWVMLRLEGTKGPAEVTVWGRRIDGQFPDYSKLMPAKFELDVPLDRAEMVAAIKPLVKAATGTEPVRLHLGGRGISLTVGAMSTTTGILELVEVEPFTIGFNPKFLLDAFESHTSPQVTLRLINPLRPAVIAGDPGTNVLIMPIRLTDTTTNKEANVTATKAKPAGKPKVEKVPAKPTVAKAAKAASSNGNGSGDYGVGTPKRMSAGAKAAQTKRDQKAANGNGTVTVTASSVKGAARAKKGRVTIVVPEKAVSAKPAAGKTNNARTGDYAAGTPKSTAAAFKAAETKRLAKAAAAEAERLRVNREKRAAAKQRKVAAAA